MAGLPAEEGESILTVNRPKCQRKIEKWGWAVHSLSAPTKGHTPFAPYPSALAVERT